MNYALKTSFFNVSGELEPSLYEYVESVLDLSEGLGVLRT